MREEGESRECRGHFTMLPDFVIRTMLKSVKLTVTCILDYFLMANPKEREFAF